MILFNSHHALHPLFLIKECLNVIFLHRNCSPYLWCFRVSTAGDTSPCFFHKILTDWSGHRSSSPGWRGRCSPVRMRRPSWCLWSEWPSTNRSPRGWARTGGQSTGETRDQVLPKTGEPLRGLNQHVWLIVNFFEFFPPVFAYHQHVLVFSTDRERESMWKRRYS